MPLRLNKEDYPASAETYVSLVPEGDIVDILTESLQKTTELFAAITEEQGNYRYAPGKWSLKEVLGHIADNERIMSYRLLRIARGDTTPLTGYDQEVLMSGAAFDDCAVADVVEQYTSARRSTLAFIRHLSDEAWSRRGIVNGTETTAAAWAYILAGHELHHLKIVKDRYLS